MFKPRDPFKRLELLKSYAEKGITKLLDERVMTIVRLFKRQQLLANTRL